MLISFPGDEVLSGGCLAAGRGFFHINARGGVEPCPFSPYSDTNLAECSLEEALDSPLFRHLRERGLLEQEHGLGDEIHHVKAEAAHALGLPELDDLCQGVPHLGVVPVEVRLRDVKEMQVPLTQ